MLPTRPASRPAIRCALAFLLAAALSTAAVPALTGPAVAAPAPEETTVHRELTTTYSCDSDAGSGEASTTVAVDLPVDPPAGKKIAARPMDLTVQVPPEVLDTMRSYGVRTLSGESDDATYRIGKRHSRPVRDLVFPETEVPDEGDMVISGQGTAAAVRLKKVMTYPVKLPKTFSAEVTATTDSMSLTTTLDCGLVKGARSKIGSLRVVEPD